MSLSWADSFQSHLISSFPFISFSLSLSISCVGREDEDRERIYWRSNIVGQQKEHLTRLKEKSIYRLIHFSSSLMAVQAQYPSNILLLNRFFFFFFFRISLFKFLLCFFVVVVVVKLGLISVSETVKKVMSIRCNHSQE